MVLADTVSVWPSIPGRWISIKGTENEEGKCLTGGDELRRSAHWWSMDGDGEGDADETRAMTANLVV
jgi:hypothetical protein